MNLIKKFYILTILFAFCFSGNESVPLEDRETWPLRRLYPYLRDLNEFKVIVVDENTHPGHKVKLLHTDKPVVDISLNFDATKMGAILKIQNFSKLFYVYPEKTILQEYSTSFGFTDETPILNKGGDRIFYVSDRFGNKEICLLEFDRFVNEPDYQIDIVVDNLHDNTSPSIDGKGMKLAYISDKERGNRIVYVKDLETGEEIVPNDISHVCTSPQLSYDGNHLAYISFYNNNYEVYYADLRDKININLSDHRGKDFNCVISGDGNRIVFQSDREGVFDIMMLDRNDLTLYNLTHDIKANDLNPAISADGDIIAFESVGKWETRCIKVIDFKRKLVFKFYTLNEAHTQPRLSKDGKVLLYYINNEIYRVNLESVKDNTGTG